MAAATAAVAACVAFAKAWSLDVCCSCLGAEAPAAGALGVGARPRGPVGGACDVCAGGAVAAATSGFVSTGGVGGS